MLNHQPLEIDLPGRVRNMRLLPAKALNALFEAVVNSIHAVLDSATPANGRITVTVIRGKAQATLGGHSPPGPVQGFRIQDNGVGFTDENFTSFKRSDSTTKAKYGGKGVGRMLWLKVFGSVSVDSVFDSEAGRQRRRFSFGTTGIGDHSLATSTDDHGTVVTMQTPHENYRIGLQHEPETLAIAIIEHCLEYLIADKHPKILLSDGDYERDLGVLFRSDLKSQIGRDTFTLAGHQLRIAHLLVRGRKNSRHALHFCADLRRVKDEPLTGKIPGLAGGLRTPGSDEDLAYQGYVSGSVLDSLVDAERSEFDFEGLFAPASTAGEEELSFERLLSKALESSRSFLAPTLQPILKENESRIRVEVETKLPQYRHLLKHKPEEVFGISPAAQGGDLDLALYRIEQRFDIESREKLTQELSGVKDPDETPDARRERLSALMQQLNDSGISKLARHVAYRRAVIEFLEQQVGLQSNGKYSLEEALHTAVCPTKSSSDELPASQMNLWLLDDRLYFHRYLSSDIPFSGMAEEIAKDSEDRPDLAIFHRTMAFGDSLDQIGAVVLVEFKRPQRDNYATGDEEKDPVLQILRYVDTLREGKALGPRGQAITIRDSTPFYAYIVADMTPTLRKLLRRHDFKLMPDGDGYFDFHQDANCYIEVLSFQKMIRDAKKRNQAFFDKLNIPLP